MNQFSNDPPPHRRLGTKTRVGAYGSAILRGNSQSCADDDTESHDRHEEDA